MITSILAEGKYGHGAIKSKLDLRDKKWHKSKLGMSSAPFDWEVGFDIEKIVSFPTKDQGTSSSCGGQAGSYLEQYLFNKGIRSAKYLYSQIFYPGGGTTLRDILNLLVKKGTCLESLCPSGITEAMMEDKSGVTSSNDIDASTVKVPAYAFVKTDDIDIVAQAIRDNLGAILEIEGENNGTWHSSLPLAPTGKSGFWRHFIYAGKAKMLSGKKLIGIHNSWGNNVGESGWQWISEDYFKSGHVIGGGIVYLSLSPEIRAQEMTILKQILALLQQWINLLGGDTKIKL